MTAAVTPLAGLLRLASIPKTRENFLGLGELIQGLSNLLNDEEKRDDE